MELPDRRRPSAVTLEEMGEVSRVLAKNLFEHLVSHGGLSKWR
jgi:hypothetical protein